MSKQRTGVPLPRDLEQSIRRLSSRSTSKRRPLLQWALYRAEIDGAFSKVLTQEPKQTLQHASAETADEPDPEIGDVVPPQEQEPDELPEFPADAPQIPVGVHYVDINVRPEQLKQIERYAASTGLTVSDTIYWILEQWVLENGGS